MAFHKIFLLHAPAGGGGLRHLGRYMYEMLVERLEDHAEPPVRCRVRAVAEDLRFSSQIVAGLASEARGPGRTVEETALAMKAKSWAREVSELVRAMEAAVGGTESDR